MISGRFYKALVRGENFLLKTEEGEKLLGFYTTRTVFAFSVEGAEKKIIRNIMNDKFLYSGKSGQEPSKLFVEEICQEKLWKLEVINRGYTFFDMEKIGE